MFAVIEDGSHQYRVQEGDTLYVDFRASSAKGDALTFEQVLLANGGGTSTIGRPTIEGATVAGEVVDTPVAGPKLSVQKLRRRKNSRTHTGHRQKFTSVLIKSIDVPGLEIVAVPDTEPADEKSSPAELQTESPTAETDGSEPAAVQEQPSSSEIESASTTTSDSDDEADESSDDE